MSAPAPLPQDPQEVTTRAGELFGTPGIYLQTPGGAAFIPAHCIPDVQRRLGRLGAYLARIAPPNLSPRERKARKERTA